MPMGLARDRPHQADASGGSQPNWSGLEHGSSAKDSEIIHSPDPSSIPRAISAAPGLMFYFNLNEIQSSENRCAGLAYQT